LRIFPQPDYPGPDHLVSDALGAGWPGFGADRLDLGAISIRLIARSL
jgi:hypothetical protein